MRSVLNEALALPVRLYRLVVSPLMPPVCRYTPSCSEYALEAIRRHGAAKGAALTGLRLLRCHPFSRRCRHDPVPDSFAWGNPIGYKSGRPGRDSSE